MKIEAKELSKVYGRGQGQVAALNRANLLIAANDFISIMGPSGSGKSTLLHLLSGLDRPTSGSVTYDGRDIYCLKDKELSSFRRQKIGFIFQQFNLLPVLTARENILMPLLLDRKQADERYLNELAQWLGICDRLNHLPHELSGGQQLSCLFNRHYKWCHWTEHGKRAASCVLSFVLYRFQDQKCQRFSVHCL